MTDSDSGQRHDFEQQLSEIRALLESQAQKELNQKSAFEKLYEELDSYKRDFIFQSEKPLLLDLLLFHDSLSWFKQSLLNSETSRDVLSDSFQYLIDEFMELLYRRDVLPQESSPKFDPQTQRAIQIVPTPELGRDQMIEKVLKRGFSRAGRPLRPEEVVVQRYQETQSESEETS